MKKNLTHLAGMAAFLSMLVAGACSPDNGNRLTKDQKKVHIYCKAVEKNGAMHLEMYAETAPKYSVIDTLLTDVWPGTKVTWEWVQASEEESFVKIGPRKAGKVITKDARKVPFTRKFRLRIPKDAPQPSAKEKYDIEFTDKDGNTVTIDPYLRIPKKV